MVSEIHSFTRFHITPTIALSIIDKNEKSNARRTKQYNTSKARTLLGFRCIILISSYGHNLKPDKPPLVNRMLQTCHWILYGEQEIINNRYFWGELKPQLSGCFINQFNLSRKFFIRSGTNKPF